MKYNISKLFIGAVAMASLTLLASCENAEYSPLSNQAYIAQTNTMVTQVRILLSVRRLSLLL